MRIDHINIAAPLDLMEELREFYCTAFALEVGPRPDFGIPGYWLYGDGKPIVHLVESNSHSRAEQPPHLDHIAFEVQGLQDYTRRLDQLGVQYSVNHIPDFDVSQVFCEDPCGIRLEANFASEPLAT